MSHPQPAGTVAGSDSPASRSSESRPDDGNSRRAPRVQSADAVSPPDQHLISECLAGRPEAFGTLVVRYQDRLHHTLVGMLGSADEAQDAAHSLCRGTVGNNVMYFETGQGSCLSAGADHVRQITTKCSAPSGNRTLCQSILRSAALVFSLRSSHCFALVTPALLVLSTRRTRVLRPETAAVAAP